MIYGKLSYISIDVYKNDVENFKNSEVLWQKVISILNLKFLTGVLQRHFLLQSRGMLHIDVIEAKTWKGAKTFLAFF